MMAQLKRFSFPIAYAGALAIVAALALLVARGRQLDLIVEGLLALGVILLGLFVWLQPDLIRQAITGRTARYGSNALIMSLAFLGILALLNFLSVRHHRRVDLTEAGRYSLSPQTIQILAGLQEPVRVTAFFTEIHPGRREAQDLLQEYAYRSNKFSYEFIDPELKPALARQYQITRDGTLIFSSGERRQEVFSVGEQDFTSAILKVSQERQKAVYFLTGHGERDIDDFTQQGYAQAKTALERDNYRVATLNLAITDTIPADLDVLVVADPRKPLLEEERKRLTGYLLKGGRALIMQDPAADTGLNEVLEAWLVRFKDDVIIDPVRSLLGDPASPVVDRYRFSQITKDLPMTFFPRARSVEQTEEVPQGVGMTLTPLIQSSSRSWGETSLNNPQVRYDEGQDMKGPLSIGMIVESPASLGSEEQKTAKSTKSRLVVLGDSDFASNAFIGALGNGDLFLNAVNWLAEEEELISIRPKPPEVRMVSLTGQRANLIFFLSVIIVPLAVLSVGAVMWWSRR
ncbi:MAG: GldG family protein [Anaerolineae bacterium]